MGRTWSAHGKINDLGPDFQLFMYQSHELFHEVRQAKMLNVKYSTKRTHIPPQRCFSMQYPDTASILIIVY